MAPSCQAYLIVDADAQSLRPDRLQQQLKRNRVASVLLTSRQGDPERLRVLVDACQRADTAALVDRDPGLAAVVGADGVHLPYPGRTEAAESQYREARSALGRGRIIGASCGPLRHDAMVLAELGVDYIAFGQDKPLDAALTLAWIAWWAELFEVPCVAWGAENRDETVSFAAAGADFVAAGPASGIEDALAALAPLLPPRGEV